MLRNAVTAATAVRKTIMLLIFLFLATCFLAYSNGANDNFKGVASLYGCRAASYREEDGQRAMHQDEITIRVDLGRGPARATVWTCDFSHEYVSINADYRS